MYFTLYEASQDPYPNRHNQHYLTGLGDQWWIHIAKVAKSSGVAVELVEAVSDQMSLVTRQSH